MFHIKKGTYYYFVIAEGDFHALTTSDYPSRLGSEIFEEHLNSTHELASHWEAVGIMAFVDEGLLEDQKKVSIYLPDQTLYALKKKVRDWIVANHYPHADIWYQELCAEDFSSLVSEETYERREDGLWQEELLPVERAIVAFEREKALDILDQMKASLKIACGDSCQNSQDTWYDDYEDENWYDEYEENDWYEDYDKDASEEVDEDEEWDDDDDDWEWEECDDEDDDWEDCEEDEYDWEDFDEDDDDWDDEDDLIEARRPQRSKSQEYRQRRKRERLNPSTRKRRNRERRRQNRKPSVKNKRKRYRRRTKHRPRSKRRAPKKF